jgi:hypothetical protein
MTPDIGCHSVIERPDSVSRVTPPITTIRKIIAAQPKSQSAMPRSPREADARAVAKDGDEGAIEVMGRARHCARPRRLGKGQAVASALAARR